MLKYLSIKNLILIKNVEINFQNGLTVFTGETGAGKSMILDSLNLISGGRLKSSIKPEEGKKTIITAIIDITGFPSIKDKLSDLDIDVDSEIIIKRILSQDGKSKSFINDNIVSLNTLKNATEGIIEIHSQFSEQGLLNNSTHIETLDNFGTNKIDLKDLKDLWNNFKMKEVTYENETIELNKLTERKEIYENDLRELKNLNPIEGEYQGLEKKIRILKNFMKISDSLGKVTTNFSSEDPPGIEKLLSENIKILSQIENLLDSETSEQIKHLESLSFEITEISKFFHSFIGAEHDSKSIDYIEERISSYKKLSKKHNIAENDLYKLEQSFKKKIFSLDDKENEVKKLKFELDEINNIYKQKCDYISSERINKAKELDAKINNEFLDLKLENAKFKTFIEQTEFNALGKDKVIFKIQTNPKSEMDEIKKISSGGELCRIALAIKVTADKNKLSTLFFDEVDSGIGGAVSAAVGQRLKRLGENRQVCVITHSPQVASVGDNHYIVVKERFETSLSKLGSNEKVKEIARMLSAEEITDEALSAANRLINEFK